MEALDDMTLRKRRDRMLNPLVSPTAHLQMFTYIAPPPLPPPFVFGAAPFYNDDVPVADIPSNITGVKRAEREIPQLDDDNTVGDEKKLRDRSPPPPRGEKRKDRSMPRYSDRNEVQADKRQDVLLVEPV